MTRMHHRTWLIGVAVVAFGLILSGCAKPPTEEIAAAQAAIDSVKVLPDVQMYAMDQVRSAEQDLARIQGMVTEKRYDEARAALPAVSSKARGAVSAAAMAKEQARASAEKAIADAKAAIQMATEKIPQAPRWGKGAIRDISMLVADVDAAKAEVAEAESMLGEEAYREGAAKARDAMAKASAVTAAVDGALALRRRR